MAINPVKVPQNVYVEDHVIGPLTLRQIILMIIGGGTSYMIFMGFQKTYGKVPLPITAACWVPFLIATAFAIVKVNDLSLFRIVLLSVERSYKSPNRVWVPRKGLSIHIRTSVALKEDEEEERKRKNKKVPTEDTQTQISRLSSIVDKGLEFDDPLLEAEMSEPTPSVTSASATTTDISVPTPRTPPAPTSTTIDRSGVRVNDPQAKPDPSVTGGLSDLSVFRDTFQPKQS